MFRNYAVERRKKTMARRQRNHAPSCEALEPRIQLSTYPVGFIGPIPAPAVVAPPAPPIPPPGVTVTMTPTPAGPIALGNGFTENLTFNIPGPSVAVSTTWTWTVTYSGFITAPTVNPTSNTTSALFYANVPGTYNIQAVTTYATLGWTGYPTPPPTTATGTMTVAPPTSVTKGGALNTPVTMGTAVTVLDTVNTAAGPMGPYVSANVQENIPFVAWRGGDRTPMTGGWTGVVAGTFDLVDGKVFDVMGISPPGTAWAATPIKGEVGTAHQSLRLAWVLPSSPVGGGPFENRMFYAPLGTLTWHFIKASAYTWELR